MDRPARRNPVVHIFKNSTIVLYQITAKAVPVFYEEFVQFTVDETCHERIRFYPSVSPENTPMNFMPHESIQMDHPMPTSCHSLTAPLSFFLNSGIDCRIRLHLSMRSCANGKSSHIFVTARRCTFPQWGSGHGMP